MSDEVGNEVVPGGAPVAPVRVAEFHDRGLTRNSERPSNVRLCGRAPNEPSEAVSKREDEGRQRGRAIRIALDPDVLLQPQVPQSHFHPSPLPLSRHQLQNKSPGFRDIWRPGVSITRMCSGGRQEAPVKGGIKLKHSRSPIPFPPLHSIVTCTSDTAQSITSIDWRCTPQKIATLKDKRLIKARG